MSEWVSELQSFVAIEYGFIVAYLNVNTSWINSVTKIKTLINLFQTERKGGNGHSY